MISGLKFLKPLTQPIRHFGADIKVELVGLTSYTTELRNKEIGIRKVFGATMPEIFIMLSASYFKLILISILIAMPIATVFMQRWLEDFAYKTGIEIWVIVAAIMACFALALITIFFQT